MGEQKQHRTDEDPAGRPRTTPAEAPGESGDEEARREADEAVSSRGLPGGRGGAGEQRGAAGREATDQEGAGGHTDKHQRPGVGREEQTHGRDG
ncbi:hypothetical protein [Streptomyces filamentosus]|uniref:hypothetical protein n=1 Tax=Streptomyces filamentosus TaxID=67294 RepID=UPI00123A3006|nr:hypothetical protein [Streptomyces filamentosus]KAA6210784.1 hypothetical protein CP979_30235 [Streptomyces filamentosus]